MTRILLALVALALPAVPAAAQSYGELNRALVDEVVVPAYLGYAEAIGRVPAAIEAVCADADQERLAAAQDAWRAAMLAWQHAQPITFGPVLDQGLAPRIEFWPDKHGTAGRQLSQALADRDPSMLDPAQLESKSVGLTSLISLERLLFDDAMLDPETSDYACRYGLAVARHQVGLADAVVEAWTGPDGFRGLVLGAETGNDVFFSAYDPAAALYQAIADTLDSVIIVKLEPPMGDDIDDARGKRAEAWRSHMALPAVAANLETVRDLYGIEGGFGDLYRALGGDPTIDQGIRDGFEQALATARSIPLPLVDAVEEPQARVQVQQLIDQTKQLRTAIRGPVSTGLGMSLGFNATDGD